MESTSLGDGTTEVCVLEPSDRLTHPRLGAVVATQPPSRRCPAGAPRSTPHPSASAPPPDEALPGTCPGRGQTLAEPSTRAKRSSSDLSSVTARRAAWSTWATVARIDLGRDAGAQHPGAPLDLREGRQRQRQGDRAEEPQVEALGDRPGEGVDPGLRQVLARTPGHRVDHREPPVARLGVEELLGADAVSLEQRLRQEADPALEVGGDVLDDVHQLEPETEAHGVLSRDRHGLGRRARHRLLEEGRQEVPHGPGDEVAVALQVLEVADAQRALGVGARGVLTHAGGHLQHVGPHGLADLGWQAPEGAEHGPRAAAEPALGPGPAQVGGGGLEGRRVGAVVARLVVEGIEELLAARRVEVRLVLDGVDDPAQEVGHAHRGLETGRQRLDGQGEGAGDLGQDLGAEGLVGAHVGRAHVPGFGSGLDALPLALSARTFPAHMPSSMTATADVSHA